MSGTITRTPDVLDRLLQEVTPQGTVSYAYDNASRRTSMTVLGQPAVIYGDDAADRLTSLTQGTATVALAYDDANRRTSLTLPNGVVATYAYSTRDELTSVTFMKDSTTLGTLTYTYDAAGRRQTVGGTWARTGLPAAVASATYDDANRQLTWGGQAFTYDDNGNLTGDGTNTYTWDARDRLASLSGGVAASFAYDPFGRRTRKTISAQTTDYLYDGDNPVQELSGGTVLANLLTGLGIDEYFTRTDGSGRRTLLGDALGSILALTDDAGVVQTAYTYQPFGQTTVTGQGNGNPFEYTGRENDGTGLYYYRARFYHPTLQRFISEDPIEFAGGDTNLYSYVANNPQRYVDPLGLDAFVTIYDSTKQPFGHSGIGVNTTATVGFHPIEGATTKDILRRGVPGRVVSDKMSHLTPIETFRIPTRPEQDACLTKFVGLRTADPGDYILGGRACGEFVRDALQSCGVKGVDPGGFVAPFGLADRLRLYYKRVP